ncbi:MAG: Os1348 family NHLP clan protein [Ktedonobacteraceae bacterium]|nr:Os1348 family NHLP clan protein [Chloroflexota bacterium]
MTRKIINAILGLASVDQAFCQDLLENPLQTVQSRNFELTPEEQEVFKQVSARDLYEFSQKLLALLNAKEKK